MTVEIKVPEIGESITEVEIGEWLKKPGDAVRKDEPLVTLESEKATVELPAPVSGTLARISKSRAETAKVGEVIAYLDTTAQTAAPQERQKPPAPPQAEPKPAAPAEPRVMPATPGRPAEAQPPSGQAAGGEPAEPQSKVEPLPQLESAVPEPPIPAAEVQAAAPTPAPTRQAPGREEEVVPMSRLRRTVAERLVEARRNAALLTTFNEIDMTQVAALRREHGEAFQKKYDVKLGFMSFFVKACVDALKQFPALNAEVRGTSIVYHNYCDIGVAVGGGKGLVVPVVRNAERLSFAEVERAIGDFARRARENQLKLEELEGGTFTISNGGVYGSLLSTPIVNPPQSGVLGLHAIQDRPVARAGSVVILPMMYVALTYDHRIVDGREAVSFLKRIKETIENPVRLVLEV